MANSSRVEDGEQGEKVFMHDMVVGTPDVNQGHRLATAPVNELGGKNPRDYSKVNSDGK